MFHVERAYRFPRCFTWNIVTRAGAWRAFRLSEALLRRPA